MTYQLPYPGSRGVSPPPPVQPKPRNGFGTTGIILGVAALVALGWQYPATAILPAVPGLVFSLLALPRLKAGEATNPASTIGGVITSSLALVLAVVATLITA